MKKITLALIYIIFALPGFCACPISGICTAPSNSVFSQQTLQDRLIPNNIDNLQKPTSTLNQPTKPFDEMRMNNNLQNNSNFVGPQPDYNPDSIKNMLE